MGGASGFSVIPLRYRWNWRQKYKCDRVNYGLFRLRQVSIHTVLLVNRLRVLLFRQIEQLRRCEIIKESEVKALCTKAR